MRTGELVSLNIQRISSDKSIMTVKTVRAKEEPFESDEANYHDDGAKTSLLSVREAARILNVAISTIYTLYYRGKLQGVNLNGRCLRIFRRSLHQFQTINHLRDNH